MKQYGAIRFSAVIIATQKTVYRNSSSEEMKLRYNKIK